MRLLDRLFARQQGYYEGMASGAAVLMTYSVDPVREKSVPNLVAAAQQAYETNGVVFACILARMMLLAEATFKFRMLKDKSLYGTEDLRILEFPWPGATTGELLSRMELDASLEGNAFLWKADDDTLVRLPPKEVTIVSRQVTAPGGGTYKEVIGYDWDPSLDQTGAQKDPQFFTVDEVAHWSPYPDPIASWRGMSWLQAISSEWQADNAFTAYKSMYIDHGTPVTALEYPAKLRPDTFDSVRDRIKAKYGGVGNAWEPLVFDQGAHPILSGGLKDLDFRAVQAGGEDRICSAAGVPPVIVGLRSSEPTENYPVALRRFADITIRPLWRSACASLQKLVPNLPPKGVQLWYDTSDIVALQAAETERAQVIQVEAAAVLTFVQAGFERESVKSAVTAGDLSLLVPDPNAPTPGVAERETITAAESMPVTGPDSKPLGARPPVTGVPPGGAALLTKPQTDATKMAMPASFPAPKTAVPNGKGP